MKKLFEGKIYGVGFGNDKKKKVFKIKDLKLYKGIEKLFNKKIIVYGK